MKIGEQIRALRKERKLTLRQLAEKTGFSHPYLSQIETGALKKDPPPDTLRKIAEALEIPSSRLLVEAGHLTEEEERNIYRYTTSRFNNVLFRLLSGLRPFLIGLENEGAFLSSDEFVSKKARDTFDKAADGTFEKYPGSITKRVFKLRNELSHVANSPFSDLYDAAIAGVISVESVANGIINKASDDPLYTLDQERQGIEKDIESLERDNEIIIEKADSLFEAFFKPAPSEYGFNLKMPDGSIVRKQHRFKINNLYYHLLDPLNRKMYRDITLSEKDRENIIRMIDAYLLHQYIKDEDPEKRDRLIHSLTEEPLVEMDWERRQREIRRDRGKEEDKPNGQD